MTHLFMNRSNADHELTLVWCGEEDYDSEPATRPARATCAECLAAAAEFGTAAAARIVALRLAEKSKGAA